jgi:hypothetical protein
MAEPYVRSEFQITAVIGGITFKDVVSISATFGLNSIPTATLQVATGINVRTDEAATIHDAIRNLKPREKAVVTLTIKTNSGRTEKMMPDGDYVIFEGYYAGIGYQRSHTSATCSIHLLHWIDDLNCSSMLNGNWMHGCPHDMAQAASQFSVSSRAGGAGGAIISPIIDVAPEIVTLGNLTKDLWEEVIKKIFEAVCKMPHPREQDGDGSGAAAGGRGGSDNAAAQEALAKIPGKAPDRGVLSLDLTGLDAVTFQNNVNNGMTHLMVSGMAYTSFWGKLVGELGSSFLFAVSPSVEFANIIPYFGGLDTPYMTIYADEYNYASFNCNVANLIESVDMYYSQQSHTGYAIGGKAPTPMSYYYPWGRYPRNGNQDFRGNILVRDPPVWISNASPDPIFSPGTTLPPNGCSHKPQHGQDQTTGGALRQAEAEKNVKDSQLVDRICEHWYKSAVLGQRQGELSGKLRFDIAPGSIVKINAAENELGAMQFALYAAVTQVSYVINAEQHVAGTSFSLTNLRNENENKIETLVKNRPPLYSTPWPGGPLAVKK